MSPKVHGSNSMPTDTHPRTKRRRQLTEQVSEHDSKVYYRVDWQAPERGMPMNRQQEQQPLQLVAFPPITQQQQQQQMNYDTYSNHPLSPPSHELSLQDLNPIPETIWSYTVFLGFSLLLWILYLLLPRGFRKQYCQANRKRFAKRTDGDMPAGGYWLPANQTVSDVGDSSRSLPRHPHVIHTQGSAVGAPPILQSSSNLSSMDGSYPGTPSTPRIMSSYDPRKSNHPPSPDHPALKKIPPNKIIAETMGRLQGRGIRLIAHGVHCDPKRVWIKLDDDTKSVTWQTEFPRRVPNQSGQVSIVLMRGSVHRIGLANVLYIDVGKKTNALQRLDEIKVPDATCFSLLTQNGSLDLQANSKLERDSLVSCFSMILDDVHANEDWRALYEASPDPSLANSSVANGGRPNIGVDSGRLSSNYPNPSDLLVEV